MRGSAENLFDYLDKTKAPVRCQVFPSSAVSKIPSRRRVTVAVVQPILNVDHEWRQNAYPHQRRRSQEIKVGNFPDPYTWDPVLLDSRSVSLSRHEEAISPSLLDAPLSRVKPVQGRPLPRLRAPRTKTRNFSTPHRVLVHQLKPRVRVHSTPDNQPIAVVDLALLEHDQGKKSVPKKKRASKEKKSSVRRKAYPNRQLPPRTRRKLSRVKDESVPSRKKQEKLVLRGSRPSRRVDPSTLPRRKSAPLKRKIRVQIKKREQRHRSFNDVPSDNVSPESSEEEPLIMGTPPAYVQNFTIEDFPQPLVTPIPKKLLDDFKTSDTHIQQLLETPLENEIGGENVAFAQEQTQAVNTLTSLLTQMKDYSTPEDEKRKPTMSDSGNEQTPMIPRETVNGCVSFDPEKFESGRQQRKGLRKKLSDLRVEAEELRKEIHTTHSRSQSDLIWNWTLKQQEKHKQDLNFFLLEDKDRQRVWCGGTLQTIKHVRTIIKNYLTIVITNTETILARSKDGKDYKTHFYSIFVLLLATAIMRFVPEYSFPQFRLHSGGVSKKQFFSIIPQVLEVMSRDLGFSTINEGSTIKWKLQPFPSIEGKIPITIRFFPLSNNPKFHFPTQLLFFVSPECTLQHLVNYFLQRSVDDLEHLKVAVKLILISQTGNIANTPLLHQKCQSGDLFGVVVSAK